METEEKKDEAMNTVQKLKKIIEKELEQFTATELDREDVDILYKLVDIDKDLENIDYWNVKKEVMKMRYNEYYDGGYGRYSDSGYGNYGRRGVPGTGRGRYRGYISSMAQLLVQRTSNISLVKSTHYSLRMVFCYIWMKSNISIKSNNNRSWNLWKVAILH